MNALPLMERELRGRSRSPATYWSRFAVALVGTLICLLQLSLSGPLGGAAAGGKYAFDGILWIAFVLCCGGCLTTADVISSERREGTLGLLFLTPVKGPDVLLGKLGAAGVASVCALLAFLPVLMIPVLAGGVTGGEAVRKALVLLDTLFLALAAGLWASARGHEWFKTAREAVLIVLLLVLVPSLLEWLRARAVGPGLGLGLLSPLITLRCAGDAACKVSEAPYWISLVAVHGTGWMLLVSAGVRLRTASRALAGATPRVPEQAGGRDANATRSCHGLPLDNANPIAWLVRRQRGVKAMIWTAALLMTAYGFMPFTLSISRVGTRAYVMLWSSMDFTVGLMKNVLFTFAAGRFFMEARRNGELELLRTTHVGASTIVSGQWEVLKRLLCWPVIVMLIPSFAWLALHTGGSAAGKWNSYTVSSILINAVSLCLQVAALCWLGMWYGLKARSRGGAIAWTVGLVQGVPYVISTIFRLIMMPLVIGRAGWTPFVWLIPSTVIILYFSGLIAFARRRLAFELAGMEPRGFDLLKSIAELSREVMAAVRKARHWTPSS